MYPLLFISRCLINKITANRNPEEFSVSIDVKNEDRDEDLILKESKKERNIENSYLLALLHPFDSIRKQ